MFQLVILYLKVLAMEATRTGSCKTEFQWLLSPGGIRSYLEFENTGDT